MYDQADEARADLQLEQQRSKSLGQELKSASLLAKIYKHTSLETLGAEH